MKTDFTWLIYFLAVLMVLVVFFFWFGGRDKIDQNNISPGIIEETFEKEASADQCSGKEAIEFDSTKNVQLLNLQDYQELCKSFVSDKLMTFVSFPTNEKEREYVVKKLEETFNDFEQFGITPIVILEPVNTNGLINLAEISEEKYDQQLEEFFKELKTVNSSKIDKIWIPYPEINTPSWDRENFFPEDYPPIVNNFSAMLERHFPNDQIGVLLNAKSYDPTTNNWNGGKRISFRPYIQDIEKGKVDIFIAQGFPWMFERISAKDMIAYEHSIAAAKDLNAEEFWINTGTFHTMKNQAGTERVTNKPERRERELREMLSVAKEIKEQGFKVRFHLFAENKSDKTEATDWSYNQSEKIQQILKEFIRDVYLEKLEFSIFS